jgi:hypothetical protein
MKNVNKKKVIFVFIQIDLVELFIEFRDILVTNLIFSMKGNKNRLKAKFLCLKVLFISLKVIIITLKVFNFI